MRSEAHCVLPWAAGPIHRGDTLFLRGDIILAVPFVLSHWQCLLIFLALAITPRVYQSHPINDDCLLKCKPQDSFNRVMRTAREFAFVANAVTFPLSLTSAFPLMAIPHLVLHPFKAHSSPQLPLKGGGIPWLLLSLCRGKPAFCSQPRSRVGLSHFPLISLPWPWSSSSLPRCPTSCLRLSLPSSLWSLPPASLCTIPGYAKKEQKSRKTVVHGIF